MVKLSVNVDHIATLREARKGTEPDPVHAAILAEMGGAQGITVHLRADRRHVQERDVRLLRASARRGSTSRWRRARRWCGSPPTSVPTS